MDFHSSGGSAHSKSSIIQITLGLLFAFVCSFANAATPNLSLTAPVEGFVGERFCTQASLSNTGSAGFGPYFQVVSAPDYEFSSAEFLGVNVTRTLVGTFSAPSNELTDPISMQPVVGPTGGELHIIRYPVGSVVAGQPDLVMDVCFDVDAGATVDVLDTPAFGLVPGYEFGDTPTGDNGPIVGTRDDRDFTPRVITYRLDDFTTEMENPPGPAFTFNLRAIADIAADLTVSPIDFSSISPIVLPPNVQFAGPVSFSIPGCTADTPDAPPPESPGGSIILNCASATGSLGSPLNEDEDVVITIPVYIVDTLDETSCSTAGALNTAKHVTLSKSASGGTAPDGTVSYTIDFRVSEYVDGIDSLVITDVIPDGLTFAGNVVLNVGGAVVIVPGVTTNSPATGQTTVVYDVTAVTGTLSAATVGSISYDATVDQLYEAAPLTGAPIRARDELTNTVVVDYDITNGALACQDNSSATIRVPDVTSSKALISPASGLLQPGDSAVWRLRLDIPSGDTQQIQFNDFFPLPVIDVSTISTLIPLASNPDIDFGPNHSMGEPLAINTFPAENRLQIIWPDVQTASSQVLEVDVSSAISSEPFGNGLVLSNILQAQTNNTVVDNNNGLNIANLTLQEPELSITKTAQAPTTNLEAGDVVTYDIEVTNDGDAEAYDVVVTDTPAAGLTSCSTSSVSAAGTGDIFSGGFTLTGDLAVGASIDIVASCTLAATVTDQTTYTNTVSVVFAALPSATPFPEVTDSADVTTSSVETFKDLITTSEAHTPETSGGSPLFPRPLVTGEIVRYRAWSYLPQGITETAQFRDFLPNGLQYVAGQTFIGLVSDSGAAVTASGVTCAGASTIGRTGNESDVTAFGLDCAIEPSSGGTSSGSNPHFTLGDLVNTEDDSNEELVIIEFNARVVGDVVDGAAMNNRMRLSTGNGGDTSNTVTAVQRKPELEIEKTVTPTSADADDTVQYVITFQHASGSVVTAYDIDLTDVIPAGLTYDSVQGITGPQVPAVPGTDTCSVAGLVVDDSNPDSSGLSITFDALAVGDVCEVRFQAVTDSGIVPGQPISNTASLGYSSLPDAGTNPNPTGSAPGTEETYSVADDVSLTIDSIELMKSIVSTSIAETTESHADSAADPRPLTLGEVIRYRLQMRLPEGDAPGFVVTDTLPDGLQYLANSGAIALVADGGGTISAAPAIGCASGTLVQSGDETSVSGITPNCLVEPTGGPFASGTDPVWNLGDLMNTDMDSDQEFVVIEFSATLLNQASNVSGNQLSNEFELEVDGSTTTSNESVAEVQVPSFGLAKRVTSGPVNQADGTYTLEYTLVVENPGPYALTSVQVEDDLDTTFGAVSYVVNNVTATNLTAAFPGFDGSANTNLLSGADSLASGVSGTITISLTLTPGNNFGSFDNTATASSNLPGGVQITDVSHDGADPDGDADGFATDDSDVTTITLAEDPEIGVAKRVSSGPTNNNDGTYTLTYGFVVENSGDVNLSNVQLTDSLATTFGAASYAIDSLTSADVAVNFPGFDGASQINLLAPSVSLDPTDTAEIFLTVTVTPGSTLGPYNNSADAVGTAPSGVSVTDESDNGSLPDGNSNGDPSDDADDTPVSFTESPEIGLAKSISSPVQNNADGTYTFTYGLFVENSGDVEVRNLQVVDVLETTFSAADSFSVDALSSSDFAVNFPGYDGLSAGDSELLVGTETLEAGQSGEVALTVTVTPGSNLGPYNNTAIVQASSPGGTALTDTSDFGTDPDGDGDSDPSNDSDVTPVSFTQMPAIGLAKVITAGPINNKDGTFTVTYRLFVENSGDVLLSSLQVADVLDTTFGAADSYVVDSVSSAEFAVNFPGYTGAAPGNLLGGSDSLIAGGDGTIDVTVTITPGANLGPYNNVATVSATPPTGTPISDDSVAGSDPDSNGNGDPSDDSSPTPVSFVEGLEIGLAKQIIAGPTNNGDGTFSLTYQFRVENTGDIVLSDVQIADGLDAVFSSAASYSVDSISSSGLTVNPAYDGTNNMLDGSDTLASAAFETVDLAVTVTPGGALGPYNNSATAQGQSPGGVAVSDTSDNGALVDENGNGNPTDDSDPTTVTFSEDAQVGIAKQITAGPTNNGDGTYSLTYQILVENTGSIVLNNAQVVDDLATTFAGASGFQVDSASSSTLSLNAGFGSGSDFNLLTGTEAIQAGAAHLVNLEVTVTPGNNLGPYSNVAVVDATSPAGSALSDNSDDSSVVDEDGNGDPTDDSDPTLVSFAESPQLGIAKQVFSAPVNNGDGSYSLVYRITVENSGDVNLLNAQVSDDLGSTFAGATSFTVTSVTSNDLSVAGGYDGAAVTGLLTGTDTLAVGQTSTIDIAVTVVPGANFGPYDNTATGIGTSPGGVSLSDDSTDGAIADANGNSDPSDDNESTPVSFSESAVIGLAKASSAPSTPNFDGTFSSTFTLSIENLGDVALSSVNVEDNLAVQLAPASVVRVENLTISGDLSSLNSAFDGVTETDLLAGTESLAVGEAATVSFDVVFNPNDNLGPFSNQAVVAAESPGNPNPGTPNIFDDSTDGSVPDATPDNDPGNDSTPTPVTYVAGNTCTLEMPEELIPGQSFSLLVSDSDGFYDDTLVEAFPVSVRNTVSGEVETITVTETAAASGEFVGSLLTQYDVAAGANDDGVLFAQHSDVIDATYTDRLTATGSVGTCSDSGVLLGLAALEGFAWLDLDTDDQFGAGEEALEGWIIRVEGPNGTVEVPVNADGSYSVPDLIPGAGYTVSLVHPDSGAVFGQLTDLTLPPQTTVIEQNLAIDPSGVFYDSVERSPIPGVTATLVNSNGTALPEACLLAGQQAQVTGDDGRYRFDVIPDADPACGSGETYTLVITSPPEYTPGFSALLPPLAQTLDPTGLGSPVRVGEGPFAPQLGESTDYHVAFTLSSGDPDVVWNHVPLDPLGVGGFSVRLTKDVNQPTTSVGGLVSYTIALENLSPVTIPGVSVVDSLPPGFSLVDESAALDGQTDEVDVTGVRPVTFAGITLLSGQRRELTYVLRAGAGVTHGEYTNTATPFVGPAQIGNSDTAEVLVVADPDFEETTVIGKVWNDRDEDGWQDSAKASRIKVVVELEEPVVGKAALLERVDRTSKSLPRTLHEGVVVRELPGRYGLGDFSNNNEVTIRGTYARKVNVRSITVTSAEGSHFTVRGDRIRRMHRGAVKRGRNSQQLEVHYRQYPVPGGGYELLVELRNQGLEEPGLPGVRLATVEGLVIETDAFGRYHIAGVDGGFMERGRNFIVKLDPATVPDGTRLISENPRVKRLSQGLMNEFDFAVHLPETQPPQQTMKLKIAEVFFEPGSAKVLPEYRAQLSQLVTALNRGKKVTLTLKAHLTPGGSVRAARKLAQARASALLRTLESLSRRDLSTSLHIRIDDTNINEISATGEPETMTSKLKGALGWMMSALVPMAQAADSGSDNCMSNICNADGVPILIVEEAEPSTYRNSRLLRDQGRVDIHGEYTTRLPNGGVIWMTEDPARPEPRLSIVGPTHVPSADGRFTTDAEFVIHTNYASYFDRLRIEAFQRADIDRREPLTLIDIDTSSDKRLFYQVDWPLKGKRVPDGAELVYRVSAIDSEGREDRTVEQRAFAIEEQTHTTQQEQQADFSINAYTLQVVSVDDGVVIFVPGHKYEERLEIRPHFPTLGAELAAQDLNKLDTIIERWVGTNNVRIEVIGHTSSVPISAKNRHIFADNYALSRARAKVVADYLANGLGEKVLRSTAIGRGPDEPLDTNSTVEGRALNRRAEIALVGGRIESEPGVHVVNRETGVATSFADFRRVAELAPIAQSVMPSAAENTADVLLKRNDLNQRRIPVYGSRVRVQGNDVGADHQVWINGEGIKIDREARFAVEYILPAGKHVTDIDVANGETVTLQRAVPIDVTGRYGFMVALADFTLSDSNISGSVEPLSGDDRYAEDMLVEGRLAFYLKGKVKGKYLITAQLDTQEEQIEDMFDNIHEKDPRSLFRRLDPDRYYPVYGDDSTVVADVNSHGRMYVRVDWDNSEAVWGNFESGVTGTELTQYSRGLYGARVTHESMEATDYEESKRYLSAFVSENQTALGHSEFLGTGGSLYYFRHTDILPGSEKLRIEVRDPDTNRVLENNALTRGLDYEVDELQGRVILSRPLLPLVQGGAPSLILDGALDGSIAVLVADYEYLPDEFDANQLVYGARGKQWFGNHVALGGTYVEEGRADEDYTLAGIDLTLQAGRDSWLKLEWGSSDATQANRFISTDGGLSFNSATVLNTTARSGDAYNVDLHLNGADFGLTSQWVTNAWYKEVDDQFSVARRDDGANVLEYGVETQMPMREWRLGVRASHFEVDEQLERREVAAQIDGEIGVNGTLASEIKYIDEARTAASGNLNTTALLLGLQYEHRLAKWMSLYAGGQTVLDDTGGYASNDQLSGGAKLTFGRRSTATIEYRDGDRGNGALVSLEQRLTDSFAVYGTMTHSTDTTSDPFSGSGNTAGMLDNAGTNFAIGQRWALNDRTRLFTERQFSRSDDFAGVGTVFGLDYASKKGWHYGFTAQEGDITGESGVVERKTLTVSAGYQGRATRFSSKLEYRDDSGAENVEQWLTSNRFEWKLSETYRLAAKLNYSESDNALDDVSDAKLVEGSLGLARRPVDTNRFNWLAKYTYLHDLQSFGQSAAETDQRSHIGAWEGIYKLNHRLALGAKVARRMGELRLSRNSGPWFKSTANFGAGRLRWHALKKWDAMAEYRWLQIEEADNQRGGWLISIDRHVANNFKIGVGYNFTDFSDDLTDLDYDHKGWFLNLLGKY